MAAASARLFEEAALGMAQVAPDGTVLQANPALCALVGYSRDQIVGHTDYRFTHPEDLELLHEPVRRARAGEIDVFSLEKRYTHSDGHLVWTRLTSRPVRDRRGALLYFVNQVEDITDRVRAQQADQELERIRAAQSAEDTAMREIGSALASTLDLGELYPLILEHAARLLPCDHTSVVVFDDGWAVNAACWGEPLIPAGTRLYRLEGTPQPWDPSSMAPVALDDLDAEQHWLHIPPWIGDERVRSAIRVPLAAAGVMIGVFYVHSKRPHSYGPAHLPLAAAFAARVAQALANARLYAAEQDRTRRLSALQAVTAALSAVRTPAEVLRVIISSGSAAIGAEAGSIHLLDADSRRLDLLDAVGYPAQEPVSPPLTLDDTLPVAVAMRSGSAVFLESIGAWQAAYLESAAVHATPDFQASAALPLLIHGQVIGGLVLSFRDAQAFGSADREFMRTLAQVAAATLERARLFAAEQARARIAEELAHLREEQAAEADALARITAVLGSVLDPSALYARILEQVARVLPCDHAAVTLYDDQWGYVGACWGEPQLPVGRRVFPLRAPGRPWLPTDAGAVTYLPDTTEMPDWIDFPPWVGEHRKRSLIAVPMFVDGEPIGFFDVTSTTPSAYSEQHLRLATLFGERVSQAVRNARLYAAEQACVRAAEDVVRLRNEFVATVSHELRSPLAAIIGYGELLEDRWEQMPDTERRERLRRIVHSAHRQRQLVDDLLLVSRLDHSDLNLRCSVTDLPSLVRRAAEEVRANYREQRVDLSGVPELTILGDSERVVQIAVNLLDNAAKYSPEAFPIVISWEAASAPPCGGLDPAREFWAVVRVRDFGPGLPLAGRERLFDRFGRLEGSRARSGRVGTGLGLYLSRQLARAMGGDLDLEATGPAGSTFRLCLPAADAVDR